MSGVYKLARLIGYNGEINASNFDNIKKAYRKWQASNHPDKLSRDASSGERRRAEQEAMEVNALMESFKKNPVQFVASSTPYRSQSSTASKKPAERRKTPRRSSRDERQAAAEQREKERRQKKEAREREKAADDVSLDFEGTTDGKEEDSRDNSKEKASAESTLGIESGPDGANAQEDASVASSKERDESRAQWRRKGGWFFGGGGGNSVGDDVSAMSETAQQEESDDGGSAASGVGGAQTAWEEASSVIDKQSATNKFVLRNYGFGLADIRRAASAGVDAARDYLWPIRERILANPDPAQRKMGLLAWTAVATAVLGSVGLAYLLYQRSSREKALQYAQKTLAKIQEIFSDASATVDQLQKIAAKKFSPQKLKEVLETLKNQSLAAIEFFRDQTRRLNLSIPPEVMTHLEDGVGKIKEYLRLIAAKSSRLASQAVIKIADEVSYLQIYLQTSLVPALFPLEYDGSSRNKATGPRSRQNTRSNRPNSEEEDKQLEHLTNLYATSTFAKDLKEISTNFDNKEHLDKLNLILITLEGQAGKAETFLRSQRNARGDFTNDSINPMLQELKEGVVQIQQFLLDIEKKNNQNIKNSRKAKNWARYIAKTEIASLLTFLENPKTNSEQILYKPFPKSVSSSPRQNPRTKKGMPRPTEAGAKNICSKCNKPILLY
jgi:hypothetical protein